MAETQIAIQPATQATPGQPAPAPAALKMILLQDGSLLQAVCPVDDQGRPMYPLTEATGQRIVQLLFHIANTLAAANNSFPPPDDAASAAGQGTGS